MSTAQFAITHFYRRSPDPEGWIQTVFLTRIIGDRSNSIYLGIPKVDSPMTFENTHSTPFDKEKIIDDIANGSLLELPVGYEIKKGESVWISSDQTVYIANSYNPSLGRQQIIYEDNVSNGYDVINYIVSTLINNKAATTVKEDLEPYLSKEYWNILTSILVKNLKSGRIDEEDFVRFGFLFRILNSRYNVRFTELLNEHDMAYSDDGFLHFQLRWSYVKWPITQNDSENQNDIFLDLASSDIFQADNVRIGFQENAYI